MHKSASSPRGSITTDLDHRSHGTVASVTISRPTKLNCLNTYLLEDLASTMQRLPTRNPNLICVILTGEGHKAFIGGANIGEMSTLSSPAEARTFITKIRLACKSIRECPVPVIGRLNEYTLSGGLEIAAACDFRVASQNAVFGMPEVKIGMPSVVEAALLPGLIGWGRTRRLLLLGDNIGAEETLKWGLVEKVVDDDALDGAVEKWVGCLEKSSRNAVRSQKQLISKWEKLGLDSAIEAGIDQFGRAFEPPSTSDGRNVGGVSETEEKKSEPVKIMQEFLLASKSKREGK